MRPCLLILWISLVLTQVLAVSLNVNNSCNHTVLLFTQTSFGDIRNNIRLRAGDTQDMAITPDWVGAINVGTRCRKCSGKCMTGGPSWNGETPFSRAEFNWIPDSGKVFYDVSLIYGYNVGMEIRANTSTCHPFACTLPPGCPVPGPGGSCFSGCCSSPEACADGALPSSGGGCPQNAFAGPHSSFFFTNCPNAYAFPTNDGASGGQPANNVVSECDSTDVILTLCPETTSNIP
ncbi:hypothetical protein M422DRAFT_60285 [Sphaerobolus stellatus SS14]|uniref:Osmotin, thaumatin-like protein n=1 Tax=Sphaerobolus stellatus (strain SS14) TaxID=990650 RepID=A0A0C9VZF5_SPHS4|nr:hypothetical protein M422DRAFT_60285 [Sphaerobolus stellatus SS14]